LRRFPAPWRVTKSRNSFIVRDAHGIALATVDWSDYPLRSAHSNGVYLLTEDEARRIAKGIARLPELLKRRFPWRNWKAA
jgi:hypothetical protein